MQEGGDYVNVPCVPDTGAQANVAGPSLLDILDVPSYVIKESNQEINHVGNESLNILGKVGLFLSHNGIEKFEEVYIIPGIEKLFLSCNLCKSLKLIHEQFPIVNVDKLTANSTPINKENVADNNKKSLPPFKQEDPALPNRPSSLPYPTTEENIPCLKEYLLNAFADTTFNTNTRPLPAMKCKDIEIHLVQPNVPHHANIPLHVPNHLRDAVKKQLDDDVAHGVLRKVPLGEATDWCHHVVVLFIYYLFKAKTNRENLSQYCLNGGRNITAKLT